ncbi:hypothetical protein ACFWOB_36895 [Streptomyces sp. NPDC058420]|uniref:hypothetical protein n=1 Tax=Streptomyces sp. NPDC058420 TaxID=3346489 RepID=UPI00365C0517
MRTIMKSRRGIVGVVAASVVGLMLPIAVSGTSSAASSATPAASSGTPTQDQWKALNSVVTATSALGVFGTSSPVLVLPSSASVLDKATALADIPAGLTVPVKVSQFTKDSLDKVLDAVKDVNWNPGGAKYLFSTSYDGTQDKVLVNSDAPASVTAALKSTYGDKVDVIPSRFQEQSNRYADNAPFFGGASITDGNGICTSGYSIFATNPDDGRWDQMQTTAGHCYGDNDLIKTTSGTWMGWVKKIGPQDIEAYVGYQYAHNIWTGYGGDSTSNKLVHSYSGLWNGLQVCVSGQTSTNHCGHPVTSTQYAYNWYDPSGLPHYTDPNYGFAYNVNPGRNVTQEGDSGAPVYVDSGNNTAAATGTHAGLISWYDSSNCGCTQYRMYGVKIGSITDTWGAQLSTG